MKTIFIVEDDKNIRDLVLYALDTSGFQGKGFESGAPFFDALKTATPDLVLLDIMLSGDNGLTILKKLRHLDKYAHIPVIMLTAKGSEYDRVTGLDYGADDYVVKPFSILELISRIKAIFRRAKIEQEKASPADTENFKEIIIDNARHTVTSSDKEVNLTYKEYELLHYLMRNIGIAISREKIMNQIWGYDFEGESRTVDVHINTLRQKLGESGRYIQTIRGIGYKLGD